MLCANLASTKLRRNQFCLRNCNLRIRTSRAELSDRKILTNFLGARGVISYTRISTHTHTHTNTHIHTHTYTHTNTHIHTHKHTYTYTHIHTHKHTYTHINTHTQIYTCISAYTYVCNYFCIHRALRFQVSQSHRMGSRW